MTPYEFRDFVIGEPIPPIPKVVLLALASRVNRHSGECYPSVSTLAEICCCSISAVKAAIKYLRDEGYVTWESRSRKYSGSRVNHYAIPLIARDDRRAPDRSSGDRSSEDQSNNRSNDRSRESRELGRTRVDKMDDASASSCDRADARAARPADPPPSADPPPPPPVEPPDPPDAEARQLPLPGQSPPAAARRQPISQQIDAAWKAFQETARSQPHWVCPTMLTSKRRSDLCKVIKSIGLEGWCKVLDYSVRHPFYSGASYHKKREFAFFIHSERYIEIYEKAWDDGSTRIDGDAAPDNQHENARIPAASGPPRPHRAENAGGDPPIDGFVRAGLQIIAGGRGGLDGEGGVLDVAAIRGDTG